jgi:hypothetical protein
MSANQGRPFHGQSQTRLAQLSRAPGGTSATRSWPRPSFARAGPGSHQPGQE